MAIITDPKSGGWAYGEVLTSTQQNAVRTALLALDPIVESNQTTIEALSPVMLQWCEVAASGSGVVSGGGPATLSIRQQPASEFSLQDTNTTIEVPEAGTYDIDGVVAVDSPSSALDFFRITVAKADDLTGSTALSFEIDGTTAGGIDSAHMRIKGRLTIATPSSQRISIRNRSVSTVDFVSGYAGSQIVSSVVISRVYGV